MLKLGLASNFQDEVQNVEAIWDIFKDVVEQWVVVDSGSTDGTQDKLREIAGDKLKLIESDMIKVNGYGYARTKLLELSEGVDYVLIFDGDERMLPEDIDKLKRVIASNPTEDMIWLPRCHYQDWEMTKVEYGGMDKIGPDWKEAVRINPDWQPRLIKRTMVGGKSKVHYTRRVHELVQGVDAQSRDLENSPVIRHFGWMKSDEKQAQVSALCEELWQKDLKNVALADSYEKEIERGYAVRPPSVKHEVEKNRE